MFGKTPFKAATDLMRKSTDGAYYRLAFKICADWTGAIAVPAILGALAGQWLDKRYGTEPKWLMVLLFIAFLSTGITITKKARRYKAEFETIAASEQKNKPDADL